MASDPKVSLVISAVDQTQAAFNSIKNSMGSVQSVAATLGATLSVGAFVAFVKGAIDAADEMNDLSAKVGVGIKELSGYKLAAEQSGASLEAVAKGIKGLSTYFNEHSDRLKTAGITAKTADDAMIQLADTFAAMPDGLQKTALAVQLFGKAGMEMIPMLNLGSQGLQEAKDKAAAYGEKMAELGPQADAFNDRLAELKLSSSALGLSLAGDVLAVLGPLVKGLAESKTQAGESAESFHVLGESLKAVLVFGSEVGFVFKAIGTEIGGIAAQIAALGKGNFAGAGAIHEAMMADAATRRAEQDKFTAGILGAEYKPAQAPAFVGPKLTPEVAKEIAAKLIKDDEAAKKAADTYRQLTQSIAEYQAQLTAQEEKQGKLTKADELALQVKLKLGVAQRAQLQPALDKIAADERELALQEAMNKRYDESIANAEKELGSIEAKIIAQQAQNDIIGLTKAQIDALEASKLNADIADKERLLRILTENDIRSANTDKIEGQLAALKELQSVTLQGAARQTIADEAKKTAEEWKRLTDDIERSLTDSLMRGFEGGKDAGKNFVDSLKNMLKTAALKIVVQAIVNPVMGSVQGAFTSGGAGANGTASGGSLSLLSSLSQGNSSMYAGFNSFAGSSIGQTLGLTNAASFVGPTAPGGTAGLGLTSLGQNLQTALPYLPAVAALAQGNIAQAGLAAVGAYFGGPIGGAIGSFVGGLFGGGGREDPHNNTDSSSVGFKLSKSGVAGFGTGYYADTTTGFNGYAPFSSTYGQTSGSGRWGDNVPLPQATIDAINTAAAQLFTGGASLASGLGLDPHIVDSAAVASGTFATVEAALSDLSDAIVTKVIPNIKDFQQANEKLGDTATRLVAEFNLTNLIAKMRGQTGTQTFGSGLAGRDQLVQLLGGASTASTAIGSYYQNFYTDAERKKNAQGEISATLKSLGINQEVTTRDQFRAIVEAQDLATESGRKMYASLVSIADAFAGITDVATAAASATNNLSTDQFKTRADYIFAQKTGILPKYAAGGDHAGGWAIVGEQGPELANLGPSRVYSHNNSRALLDTTALQNEIAALRSDLRAGQAAMAHSLKIMEKKIKQWDGDGMPAVRT